MSPEMLLQTCNINRTMLPEQCYREQDAFRIEGKRDSALKPYTRLRGRVYGRSD